jgi:hypothetical protein
VTVIVTVIPALGRKKQDDLVFKAGLGNIARAQKKKRKF